MYNSIGKTKQMTSVNNNSKKFTTSKSISFTNRKYFYTILFTIAQIRCQPAFRISQTHAFTLGIVRHLILA